MTCLRSYGCSFIYGTDLADAGTAHNANQPSHNTWPALLAQSAGFEYCCRARGGSGNLHILEKLLRDIAAHPTDFYVVQWTWIDRFDYTDTEFAQNDHWYTITPTTDSQLADVYYRKLHSEFKDKFVSLTYVKTAIDALHNAGAPYLMTYMDELMLDNKWNVTDSVRYLQEQVQPYLSTFNNSTFLEFSKRNQYQISEKLHPLEEAHAAGYNSIKQKFQEQLQFSIREK